MSRAIGRLAPGVLLFSMIAIVHVSSAPLHEDIEVNGVRLQYVEDGIGEPVVFVHGAVSDSRAWEPVRDQIAKNIISSPTRRDISAPPNGRMTARNLALRPTLMISPSSSRR
jgi:hypothetical protein